jgi:hypothetical protein
VKRITVVAKEGDTVESIGRRYDVKPGAMERDNHQHRRHVMKAGETVVVYVPNTVAAAGGIGPTAVNEPAPNGPLPAPPVPDLLP